MLRAFEFCLPTTGAKVPAGPEWLYEIKYDGYRLRLERDADRVRLITKGGYPRIVEAALNRLKHFVIDGEAPTARKRSPGPARLLICCADYHCSHSIAISGGAA